MIRDPELARLADAVLTDPVIIEVEPRGNVAVGRAPWGLAPWAPPGGVRRISAAPLAVVTIDTAHSGAGHRGRSAGGQAAALGLLGQSPALLQ